MPYKNKENAEQNFQDAFYRLKRDMPKILPKGTPVTQNNVAREAGRDPSSLKKSRYPALIDEIQSWINEFATNSSPTPRQLVLKARRKNMDLKERTNQVKIQRDLALSRLVEADSIVLDLVREVEQLKSTLALQDTSPIKKKGTRPVPRNTD
jgi:hypothetical protein